MDLSAYDRKLGAAAKPLPIVKFIDDFIASFSIVAADGPIWTLNTDLNATRSKCGLLSGGAQCPGLLGVGSCRSCMQAVKMQAGRWRPGCRQ